MPVCTRLASASSSASSACTCVIYPHAVHGGVRGRHGAMRLAWSDTRLRSCMPCWVAHAARKQRHGSMRWLPHAPTKQAPKPTTLSPAPAPTTPPWVAHHQRPPRRTLLEGVGRKGWRASLRHAKLGRLTASSFPLLPSSLLRRLTTQRSDASRMWRMRFAWSACALMKGHTLLRAPHARSQPLASSTIARVSHGACKRGSPLTWQRVACRRLAAHLLRQAQRAQ
jgi:hypothetical protein